MRMNHSEGHDVTLINSTPSSVEVALVLCERALQRFPTKYYINPAYSATLYAWYIQKVAFINLIRKTENDDEKEIIRDGNAQREVKGRANKEFGGGMTSRNRKVVSSERVNQNKSEIDFFQAYQAVYTHGSCETMFSADQTNGIDLEEQNQEVQQGRQQDDATTVQSGDELMFSSQPQPNPSMLDFPTEVPCNSGFRLILSLLLACTSHSDELCIDVCRTLVELFYASSISLGNLAVPIIDHMAMHAPGEHHTNVDVLVLTEQFFNLKLDEESALLALGNATQSFIVWMTVSWSCASYEHQTRLSAQVSQWVSCLSKILSSMDGRKEDSARSFAVWVKTAAREYPLPRYCDVKSIMMQNQLNTNSGSGDTSNVVRASQILRDIFEGHATDGIDMLESLFTRAGTSHLPDNYVSKLLAMQGSAVVTLVPRQELLNHGSRLTLFNITCGMLAYVAFYISLRSFDTAQQCAGLAIKVGQQLHSNHILALAHYCSFVVQMNSGRASEAADSISIALHLSAAEEVPPAASEHLPISGICYANAAELLLFFPGVVNGSLRSALSVGLTARRQHRTDAIEENEASSEGGIAGAPPGAGGERGAPTTTAANSRMEAVQTIAQTARHALGMFEIEALLRPTRANAWIDVVASLSRETLRIAGSIYGMTTPSRALDAAAMRQLLVYLEEESEVHWIPTSIRPPLVLLAEMVRHTAHKMLAMQGGRAWHLTLREHGPLHLVYQFLRGVQQHYGKEGLQMATENVFFGASLRYVQGCWLARNGFVAAAYDLLEATAYFIYTLAGVPNKNERGKMASEIGLSSDATSNESGAFNKSYEKLLALYIQKTSTGQSKGRFFWPSDLLLLLADIQHKRGELALYAGYSEAIDDMAEVLNIISSSCSFVYGTLVSQLLQLMSLQQRFDFSGILQHSVTLLKSVEKIGFPHLADSIRVRQATTLRCAGRWMETLELLEEFSNAPPIFEPWQLLTRLTAGSETLLSSTAFLPPTDAVTTMTTDMVVQFLHEGIRELRVRGYLGTFEEVLQRHFSSKNGIKNESVGVSLHELLSIHASAARSIEVFLSSSTLDSRNTSLDQSSVKNCMSKLAELLCERHQLCYVHECLVQRGALEICEMLLKGELGTSDILTT